MGNSIMLAEYLDINKILFGINATTYQQAIEQMLQTSGLDTSQTLKHIMDRESIMSTVLGRGVALPRAILDSINKTVIILAIMPKGLELKSFDLSPIKIIILHLFTKNDNCAAILAHTLRLMNDDNLKKEIISCRTSKEVIDIIKEWEEEE